MRTIDSISFNVVAVKTFTGKQGVDVDLWGQAEGKREKGVRFEETGNQAK